MPVRVALAFYENFCLRRVGKARRQPCHHSRIPRSITPPKTTRSFASDLCPPNFSFGVVQMWETRPFYCHAPLPSLAGQYTLDDVQAAVDADFVEVYMLVCTHGKRYVCVYSCVYVCVRALSSTGPALIRSIRSSLGILLVASFCRGRSVSRSGDPDGLCASVEMGPGVLSGGRAE